MGPRRLLVVLALTFRTDALGLSSGSRELLMQKESQQGAAKVAKHEWHSLLTNAAKAGSAELVRSSIRSDTPSDVVGAAYRKEVAQGIQETNEKEAAGLCLCGLTVHLPRLFWACSWPTAGPHTVFLRSV